MAFEFGVEIRPDGTSGRYIRGALDGGGSCSEQVIGAWHACSLNLEGCKDPA